MWETTPSKWKQVYMDACRALAAVGIQDVHLRYVLFDMLYTGSDYNEALRSYAEFRGEAPERMHSYLCMALLRCGMEVGPGDLLTRLVKGDVKTED